MADLVAILDRAPEGVRRLVYSAAAGEGPLGRLADRIRFRPDDAAIPPLPTWGEAAARVVIAPANSAGQGFRWARALEEHLDSVEAFSMREIGSDPFASEVDIRVPVAVYQRSRRWHSELEAFLAGSTHVIWESGLRVLGRRHRDVEHEIASVLSSGGSGALLFHGSDIRPPSGHAAENPWSPFETTQGRARALADSAAANALLARRTGLPVFVSTPDLLRWMPEAIWCPVVVDADRWREERTSIRTAGPLVVVHAPSQAWLKGTARIEPVLRRLHAEGVIEYRQTVGVPHSAMPAFYAEADIVLDQFSLGIYGVAACEALASGRVVMSHVDEVTRGAVLARTGLELPIHETTIDTLESELRAASARPELFERAAQDGPAFVASVHDGVRSAAAMAGFLGASA